jgi:hypothetical protein
MSYSGNDCVSHIAIPNQNAGCSWKFQVAPVPAWFGWKCGSLGSVSWYLFEFPEPFVFE